MNTPAPVPDPGKPSLVTNSNLAGLAVGGPLAVTTVWMLETFVLHGPMDSLAATAVGSVGSVVLSGVWHVVSTLIDRALNKGG